MSSSGISHDLAGPPDLLLQWDEGSPYDSLLGRGVVDVSNRVGYIRFLDAWPHMRGLSEELLHKHTSGRLIDDTSLIECS